MRLWILVPVLLFSVSAWSQSPQQTDQNAPPRSVSPQSQSQQSPDDIQQSQPLPRSSDQSQSSDEAESPEESARPGVPPPDAKPDTDPHTSSSRSAIIDLSPPAGDRSHSDVDITGVREMTPWDPMKCAKDVEVGDYYFRQGNMKAAESRYREALYWKPGDAEATIRMARVFQKTGRIAEAQQSYQNYLKILPNGPYAKEAKKALEKLLKES